MSELPIGQNSRASTAMPSASEILLPLAPPAPDEDDQDSDTGGFDWNAMEQTALSAAPLAYLTEMEDTSHDEMVLWTVAPNLPLASIAVSKPPSTGKSETLPSTCLLINDRAV